MLAIGGWPDYEAAASPLNAVNKLAALCGRGRLRPARTGASLMGARCGRWASRGGEAGLLTGWILLTTAFHRFWSALRVRDDDAGG